MDRQTKLLRKAAAYASEKWWAKVRELNTVWVDGNWARTGHFVRAAIWAGRIARGEPVIQRPVPGLCNNQPTPALTGSQIALELCQRPKGHVGYCASRDGDVMWWPR